MSQEKFRKIKQILIRCDQDDDGRLDKNEFCVFMDKVTPGAFAEEDVGEIFGEIDSDASGFVTVDEYMRWAFDAKGLSPDPLNCSLKSPHYVIVEDKDIGDDDSEDDEEQVEDCGDFKVGDYLKVKDDVDKPKFNWGKVKRGDVGRLAKITADRCRINFPRHSNWQGYLPDMEKVDADDISVGDRVRVHPDIETPKYNWGKIKRGDVGTVRRVDDDGDCKVDFSRQKNWSGLITDMEKMTEEEEEAGEETFEVGSKVTTRKGIKPKYGWGKVRRGDVGVITKIYEDNKDKCKIDFQRHKKWTGWLPDLVLADVEEEVEEEEEDEWEKKGFLPGAIVKVKEDVETPKYNWGKARHGMEGRLQSVDGDVGKVEFPSLAKLWTAYLPEMELVPDEEGEDEDVDSDSDEEPFEDGIKDSLDSKSMPWKRVKEFNDSAVLFGDIHPNDIDQGSLGDCWLLAGFASLAEFPQALKLLFKRDDLSKRGRYQLRLYDLNKMAWANITMDDKLPSRGRNTKYAHITSDGEAWAPLLEKACAILYGNYENLSGGWGPTAWASLLGCTQGFSMKRPEQGEDKWQRRKMIWTSNDSYNLTWSKWPDKAQGHSFKSSDELFAFMLEWDNQYYLMSASAHLESDDSHTVEGIVQSHEYSLIRVCNNPCGSGAKLVQLRNPWGDTEWQGAWSDKSSTWEDHPEVAEKLKTDGDDGMFWISLEDFARIFDYVCVMERAMPTA